MKTSRLKFQELTPQLNNFPQTVLLCLVFLVVTVIVTPEIYGVTNPNIVAGASFTVALKSDGTVWTWGRNDSGQLGNGTADLYAPNPTPGSVSGLSNVIAVAAGNSHTVALKSDGTVWDWGNNYMGELGNGTTSGYNPNPLPVPVSGLSNVIAVAAGNSHTIALKSDGTVWDWGSNYAGQLGNGTTSGYNPNPLPVPVSGLSNVIAVAGGGGHTVALKADRTVWVWGQNESGQVGNGNTSNQTRPVLVSGLSNVIAIAAGSTHTIALKSDGTIWTWGGNYYGELGNGNTNNQTRPVPVSGLTGVTAIAGGLSHTVASKADGTVWAWGFNEFGALGNGTTSGYNPNPLPVPVSGLSNVIAVAGGDGHTVALKSDGTVWGCGVNGYGQLGIGSSAYPYPTTPVLVPNFNLGGTGADNTPPTVAIDSPTDGAAVNVTSITVSGTALDPGSPSTGVVAVKVRVNGGSWQTATGTTNWNQSVTLTVGDNTIEVQAFDGASTPNSSTIATRTVTFTPPVLTGISITGSSSVPAGSANPYTCTATYSAGSPKDVSAQAVWSLVPQNPLEFQQMSGRYFLAASVADVTASYTVTIQAIYTEGAIAKTNTVVVTVQPQFHVDLQITTEEFSCGDLSPWSLQFNAVATAANGSCTYQWDLNGDGQFDDGTGQQVVRTYSDVGSRLVGVRATDSSGVAVAYRYVTLNQVDNYRCQPTSYVPTAPAHDVLGGAVKNASGGDFTFDPAKIDDGLIIITHGLCDTATSGWMQKMAANVVIRLGTEGKRVPNICLYDWHEMSNPDVFDGRASTCTVGLGSLLNVRVYGLTHGLILADWIRTQIGAGNINPAKPIQIIGHSAGGFVASSCAKALGTTVSKMQITSLDTPVPELSGLPAGLKSEYYITHWGGALEIGQMENTSKFHKYTVNYYLSFGWGPEPPLCSIDAHGWAYNWYTYRTIDDNDPPCSEYGDYAALSPEGFQYSPWEWGWDNPFPSSVQPAMAAQLLATSALQETPIDGFSTFGTVVSGNGTNTISEPGDAGIYKTITLPPDVESLKFKYRFTTAGDGDFLSVHWGTNTVLYIGLDKPITRDQYLAADVSLEQYTGQTDQLAFQLISRGVTNAVLSIADIVMVHSNSCSYSIAPTNVLVEANATNGSVSVTAGNGCDWTATNNVGWITITAGSTGNSSGTISYSVAANTSTNSRSGTLTIAGKTFTVSQAGGSIGTDLLAYYPFDGSSDDASGHGLNGSLMGNPAFTNGIQNAAVHLNGGSNQYVRLPYISLTNKTAYTVTLWAKIDPTGAGDGEALISFGREYYGGMIALFCWGSPPYQFGVDSGGSDSWATVNPFPSGCVGNWAHYALVYSNGVLKGLVNGQLVTSNITASISQVTTNCGIGKHWYDSQGSTSSSRMVFDVDEVRIYDRALSNGEIQQLYAMGQTNLPTRIMGVTGNLAFGNVTVNTTSTRTMTIANSGNMALNVSSISYSSSVFSGAFTGSIAAGGATNVTVSFTPSAAVSYNATVTVNSDKTSGTNTIAASGTGITSPGAPTITTSCPLPSGTQNASYSTTLAATGGTTPYTWTYSSGSLPPGLGLSLTTGVISGTPTSSGTYTLTLRCTGNNSLYSEKSCSITINAAVDTIPPTVSMNIPPANGQIYTNSPIALSGTATDPGSPSTGVALVQLQNNSTNGTWVTATGTSSWSLSMALTPGANALYMRARDNAGNYSALSVVNVTYNPPVTKVIGVTGNLAFGDATTGTTVNATMTITNSGNAILNVGTISYPTGFSGNWSSGTISAGGSRAVTVTFAPVAVQSYGGTISVSSDATSGAGTISASGNGIAGVCNYSLSATSTNLAAISGGGGFTVFAGSTCPWTAVASTNWIQTTSSSTGTGIVNYTIMANTGPTRSGTINVQSRIYTVNQAAGSGGGTNGPVIDALTVTNVLLTVAGKSIVVAGEAIGFDVLAHDSGSLALSYQWSYGDGTTTPWSQLSAGSHAYTATGCVPYTASVTVSNGIAAISSNLTVSTACQLLITKCQGKLNFAKSNGDSCSLTATLDPGTGFSAAGKAVTLDIGGAQLTYTLDGKGRYVGAQGTVKLAYSKSKKVWTLTAKLKAGNWQDTWKEHGLKNADVTGALVTLPVVVLLGDEAFAADKVLTYTAKAGKSGSAK